MHRIRLLAVTLVLLSLVGAPRVSPATVLVQRVAFEVSNPAVPGSSYVVRGALYAPSAALGCSASVLLLLHGLSYGKWAWDFEPQTFGDTYSVARTLAARGYPAVAIDELGYDSSHGDESPPEERVDGYSLTVQAYAEITAQIVRALRAGSYSGPAQPVAFAHVGLVGHSAGTEISELTAGAFGGVDVLVATAYTHFPSQAIVEDFSTGDVPRALQDDYEYFGGTVARREEYMFNRTFASSSVMARDAARANLTPSGEILSISNQPSRWAMSAIMVPVLLVLAERDFIFPAEFGDEELALFVGSADKTLHVVPTAGHSFMLHPNAPAANDAVVEWLRARQGALPSCGPAGA